MLDDEVKFRKNFASSSNGRTTVSGAVYFGSSPNEATLKLSTKGEAFRAIIFMTRLDSNKACRGPARARHERTVGRHASRSGCNKFQA